MEGWRRALDFKNKPRQVMCPDFAQTISERIIIMKIKGVLQQRLEKWNRRVRKLQLFMGCWLKLSRILKGRIELMWDFYLVSHLKLNKGSTL